MIVTQGVKNYQHSLACFTKQIQVNFQAFLPQKELYSSPFSVIRMAVHQSGFKN